MYGAGGLSYPAGILLEKKGACVSRIILFSLLYLSSVFAGAAAIDVYDFATNDDRLRYRGLVDELRCPKCQNQNLSDSNSQIAIDLRGEVARMVLEGKSNREVIDFMVQRYGDFVLYRPPVQSNTMVLWVGPSVMFGLGLLIFGAVVYGRSKQAADVDDDLDDESDENSHR